MKKHAVVILASFFLFGCAPYDPFAREFTIRKPEKLEIVGVYTLSLQTMNSYAPHLSQDLKSGAINSAIEILPDGTYEFRHVPNFEDESHVMEPKFIGFSDIDGKWSIDRVGSVGDGGNKIDTHWGLRFTEAKGSMSYPGFMGRDNPDRLIFTFSDPDSGEVMIFKKK